MEGTVQTYLQGLASRPDTLGVAVFGSYARGDARPDADVDVFVLVSDGVWRDVESSGGRTYELLFASEKEAKDFYAQNPDDCVSTWSEAKIVYDRDGRMASLAEYASVVRDTGKRKAARSEILHRKFEAEDKLRAARHLAESDFPTAFMSLHELAGRLIECHFAKVGTWSPPPKLRLTALRSGWPELAGLFDEFYSQTHWEERVRTMEKIIAAVFAEH